VAIGVAERMGEFEELVARAFDVEDHRLGVTHALLLVQGGEVVFERYGDGIDAETTLPSWSMAKSMLHAVVGILVLDGAMKLDDRVVDGHPDITVDHLLHMASGLSFREDYVNADESDVVAMLYRHGRADMAAFAAAQPRLHEPGTVVSYASGTSNILSGAVARIVGPADAYLQFLRERLFGPLGMTHAAPKLDGAGTWVASSWSYDTARDFARFGELYLRDGVWEGERLLPEGWVDHARSRLPGSTGEETHGAHWWLEPGPPGSLSAHGYDGQRTVVVPSRDLVIVRLGETPLTSEGVVDGFLTHLIAAFR
jgi:CubicO group peptidase (beta-lactamase class C family)